MLQFSGNSGYYWNLMYRIVLWGNSKFKSFNNLIILMSLYVFDKYKYIFAISSGVPSQPSNFRAIDIGETVVTLSWSKPLHSGENIVHYELYWNDTYANEQHHK